MLDLAEEVTGKKSFPGGKRELPGFSRNVICDEEIACRLRPLHEMVMKGTGEFGKEETLLFLLSYLIQNYGKPFESCIPEFRQEIERACGKDGGADHQPVPRQGNFNLPGMGAFFVFWDAADRGAIGRFGILSRKSQGVP